MILLWTWLWFSDVVTRSLSRNNVWDFTAYYHLWWKKQQKRWLHNSVNVLKNVELYTLHGWVVWYVNYIWIKQLEKKAAQEDRLADRKSSFRKSHRKQVIQMYTHHLPGMAHLLNDIPLAKGSLSWTEGIAFWTSNIFFLGFQWGQVSLESGFILETTKRSQR